MGQSIPRSVAVITALHLVAALLFGALAHIDPSNQFPELVQNDDGLFAVGLYANRNIGIALALGAALALRSRWALMGLMAARFVTDVGDLLTALTTDLTGGELVGQFVFFGLLFASELWVLRTLFRLEQDAARPASIGSEVTV